MALDLENFEQHGRFWYRRDHKLETPHELRDCEECSQPCLVTRQGIRRGGGRFCSNHCRAEAARRSPFTGRAGELHPQWKGDAVGYAAAHERVQRRRGRAEMCVFGCQDAGMYHWANLTGNYPDPDDYAQMCVLCHRRFDAAIRRMEG